MKEHTTYYIQMYLAEGGHSQVTTPTTNKSQAEADYEHSETLVPEYYSSVQLIEIRKRSIRSKHKADPPPAGGYPAPQLITYAKVGIGDYLYCETWGLSHIVQMTPIVQTSIPPLHKMQLTLWSKVKEQTWTLVAGWETIHEMRDDWPDKY